ncbi:MULTISPECIES: ABC transporter substrate-binding protein [Glycomyces]|uniref:Carbohydrate ABC transporter substrate-binding protein (CUT1 family) n=1 Tax=Glycomyces artemisiae TaxID=1076443 RepID=A0A2T0UVM0_9ACTN|nr:ABC transporter substrate-binding protein [Glycomyces artemisiae]PRY61985.1 carbohydrate ABC transporter substrate-binding protein (CUT1 family) [Glycomyces artemisiae]
MSKTRRITCLAAAASVIALAAAACGAPEEDGDDRGALPDDATDCANYEQYGDLEGETVSIMGSILDAEADEMQEAWSYFESCTGATIEYEGTAQFEADMKVRVDGGNAPDIALFPQPGLMSQFKDDLVPASDELSALATEGWTEDWLNYGTIDGTLYAAPNSSNAKSFIWYSPSFFADNGYEVPQTWDELIALSDTIAESGVTPWCAGFESGGATGWPGTDWIEDIVLREGTDVYDQWVSHEIPFNDPQIVTAIDKAGSILQNEDYIFNGTDTISTTAFQTAGHPILDGSCAFYRMASFYGAMWPEGTTVAEDGDVFAFRFPESNEGDNTMLVGGEFVAAFSDSEATEATRQFLASELYHNSRLQTGPWSTARQGVDPANATTPINQFATEILTDPAVTVRFDGSDLMPGEVGASSFWTGMVEWADGAKDSQQMADDIENSWP